MKLGLDAMGGDYAPDAVVEGASLSVKAGVLELTTSQIGSWS